MKHATTVSSDMFHIDINSIVSITELRADITSTSKLINGSFTALPLFFCFASGWGATFGRTAYTSE